MTPLSSLSSKGGSAGCQSRTNSSEPSEPLSSLTHRRTNRWSGCPPKAAGTAQLSVVRLYERISSILVYEHTERETSSKL
jgi:hypothetical protein